MKGFISVDIPTQPYLAAYIKAQLGDAPRMNGADNLGICKFFTVLLTRQGNYNKSKYHNKHYTVKLRVYIDMHTYRNRGHCLNETNVRDFNLFIKGMLKARYHELMNDYVESTKSLTAALAMVREKLRIQEDDWSDESMLRDYYRYRERQGLPILYERNFSRKCPIKKSRPACA